MTDYLLNKNILVVNFVSAVVHVFYLLYKELSNKSVGLRFSKPELFHSS